MTPPGIPGIIDIKMGDEILFFCFLLYKMGEEFVALTPLQNNL